MVPLPILPLRQGVLERQTHEYAYHGLTNLCAALKMISGEIIGTCADRHRQQEDIYFIQLVDPNT